MIGFSLYKCHVCKSENLTGGSYDGDFDSVWQEIECEDCGAMRVETYVISQVETTDENDKQIILWDAETDK